MKNRFFFLLAVLTLLVVAGCSNDSFTPECDGGTPTYDGEMKTLIDQNCAISGCHGAGSSRGDYTSFAGLLPDLNNGKFTREVLTDQSMPRGGSLTQVELNSVQCWADNGFAEN